MTWRATCAWTRCRWSRCWTRWCGWIGWAGSKKRARSAMCCCATRVPPRCSRWWRNCCWNLRRCCEASGSAPRWARSCWTKCWERDHIMTTAAEFHRHLQAELQGIRDAGLYKAERVIATPQSARIRTADGREVINLCANNYLGLSSHPAVMEAANEALRTHGYGMSSVRFICGTQDLHKTLEARLSRFLGTEDTILYGSAFDANGGLFETLLGEQDAVISDALNHASIIDGIRLCKAKR